MPALIRSAKAFSFLKPHLTVLPKMKPMALFYSTTTLLALITSTQATANISLPSRLADGDVRFGIRGHYGSDPLNIISVLMNTIHGLANLAHQPFHQRIPGFHVDILPWYADLDISIQPAGSARDVEVRVAVTALYYVVYDMIKNKIFTDAEFEILWDGVVVGHIQIGNAARTGSGVSNAAHISSELSVPLVNDTIAGNLTAGSGLVGDGLHLYFHYLPDGARMSFQEVFVTLMAALKTLSQFPSAQVVEPFQTGARGFNARIQFYGDETPRTEPPFLTYAVLVDTVRQIPFHMVESKKFAELQVVVAFDEELLGQALLERGSPELGGVGSCGGGGRCDVSSS